MLEYDRINASKAQILIKLMFCVSVLFFVPGTFLR